MKIVFVAHTENHEGLGRHVPGDGKDGDLEVDDEVAVRLLNQGFVIPYKESEVERATVGAPETATGKPQAAAKKDDAAKETAAKGK